MTKKINPPWWSINHQIDKLLEWLDKKSEPTRRKLAEEWVTSEKPSPGLYRIGGIKLVVTESGEILFD